jgi:2-(1,2-epoxy-1,2-dihydrophenyl)acetyl-CoA isomerase
VEQGVSEASGLQIEQQEGVTLVRLARPEQRNTIDEETCDALTAFLREANHERTTRAIVLTGTGRDFCTGAQAAIESASVVAETTALDYRWKTQKYHQLFEALWEIEIPVVSAVNGTVAGAGWLMALLADLVVAARGARWSHVFVKRGMVPHAGDPYYLPRIIPFHRLNELAMLGEPVESETLSDWGVVNRLVDADDVLSTALELGHKLAVGPTRSIGMAKRLYRRSLESDLRGAYDQEVAALALMTTTSDRIEGVKSFIERRPPEFKGN